MTDTYDSAVKNQIRFIGVAVNGKIRCQWDGRIGLCDKCGKEIGWCITENNERIAFNVRNGNSEHIQTCKGKKIEIL